MQTITTLNNPGCFSILSDESTFYALCFFKNQLHIFNYSNNEQINAWRMEVLPNLNSKPILDENNLYIPIQGGQILALDKFSGETVFLSDLGSQEVISPLFQDNDHLYCFAALPIRTGKELKLNNFCQIKIDKNSGRKIFQSNIYSNFKGYIHPYFINNFDLHSDAKSMPLTISAKLPPVVLNDYIVCLNNIFGEIQIIDKNFENMTYLKIEPFNFALGSDNNLYLFTNTEYISVSLPSGRIRKLSTKKINNPLFWNGITGFNEGEVINLSQDSYQTLQLPNKINNIFAQKENLFATTDNNIFIIGAKN